MECAKSMKWGAALSLMFALVGLVTFSSHVGHVSRLNALLTTTTRFEVKRGGNSTSATFQLLKNGEPFVVKGVCYSPMEINSDINDAAVVLDPHAVGKHGKPKHYVIGSMFGDSFWDPPHIQGTTQPDLLRSWFGLWGSGRLTPQHSARADLAKISQILHANAIRVYFMQTRVYSELAHKLAKPPQECEKRTHTLFLDEAYKNGLFVLVGLPLPIHLFHIDDYKKADHSLIEWWEFVLKETVAEVGNHPAILGFTILNELDDEPNAFPGQGDNSTPTSKSDFFHNQVVKYASIVKAGAPDKLVGWALHDCPSWLGFAANATPTSNMEYLNTGSTYLAQISSAFDYYGVNTYQSISLRSVLGTWGDKGELGSGGKAYGAPSVAAHMKPVLLTEMGWPATARAVFNQSATPMVDNMTTETAVASLINNMFAQIYNEFSSLCIGSFYFEYTDEWWKTPKPLAGIPNVSGPWHHDGGNNCANFGFPNLCNDEESFGLYKIARGGGRAANSSNFGDNGIVLPVDELIPRTPMVDALAEVFTLYFPQQVPPQIAAAAIPRTPNVSLLFLSCMVMLGAGLFFLTSNLGRAFRLQGPAALQQPFLQVL